MRRFVRYWTAVIALGVSSAPALAGHSIFHIFTPQIEVGAWGAEALSGFGTGLSSADGQPPIRAAHEFAVHTGVTEYWMAKLALGLQRASGDSYQLDSIALENVFRFAKPTGGALDAAWFTSLSAGITDDATNAIEFGPVISYGDGPFALMLNPFFEKTFGRNREDGIALTYGWRATYQISDLISIGAEGYGAVENLGDAPAARDQLHSIGPVLYLGHVHGNPSGIHGDQHAGRHAHDAPGHDGSPEWHGEIGVLFGLSEATPSAAIKLNIGADF